MWCGGLTRNTANTNTPFSENNTTRKFVVGFVAFSLVVAVSKRQRFVMILLLARLEEKIREGFDYYSALISTVSAINALFFSSFSIILPPLAPRQLLHVSRGKHAISAELSRDPQAAL